MRPSQPERTAREEEDKEEEEGLVGICADRIQSIVLVVASVDRTPRLGTTAGSDLRLRQKVGLSFAVLPTTARIFQTPPHQSVGTRRLALALALALSLSLLLSLALAL